MKKELIYLIIALVFFNCSNKPSNLKINYFPIKLLTSPKVFVYKSTDSIEHYTFFYYHIVQNKSKTILIKSGIEGGQRDSTIFLIKDGKLYIDQNFQILYDTIKKVVLIEKSVINNNSNDSINLIGYRIYDYKYGLSMGINIQSKLNTIESTNSELLVNEKIIDLNFRVDARNEHIKMEILEFYKKDNGIIQYDLILYGNRKSFILDTIIDYDQLFKSKYSAFLTYNNNWKNLPKEYIFNLFQLTYFVLIGIPILLVISFIIYKKKKSKKQLSLTKSL